MIFYSGSGIRYTRFIEDGIDSAQSCNIIPCSRFPPVNMSVYAEKFQKIAPQTVFALLPDTDQSFVRKKAHELQFTQQELRRISEIALDRIRWKETRLPDAWPDLAPSGDNIQYKKQAIAEVERNHRRLRNQEKDYRTLTLRDKPVTQKPVLKTTLRPQLGLGRCPVASERTRCCNLMTLDAVEKCGFDCSYCSIQSFYHGNEVVFDNGFADKLAKLKLDPNQTYHIGTGQSSDSLMWGNHNGVLEALCEFAERHPNVILELKTKSRNIGWLLANPIPGNMICTWSLNPQTIIDHEEHRSANLHQRIESAKRLADKGCLVGFHFHPIIRYKGWKADYRNICLRLTRTFQPDQVALVSMGTLTYTKSVMKTIRKRNLTSKILQMPLEEIAGKYSYPVDIKMDLFKWVYGALREWHEKVFFYLCMEAQSLWKPVFGFDYDSNGDLEAAMKNAYFDKIKGKAKIKSGNMR